MKTAMTISEALDSVKAFGAAITSRTITNWCNAHDIGELHGSIWLVDPEKLQALLDSDLSGFRWGKLHVVQRAMRAARERGEKASLI